MSIANPAGDKSCQKYQLTEEDAMKGLIRRFEQWMVAITFAEVGEFDTAREIMNEPDQPMDVPRKRRTDTPYIQAQPGR